MLPLRWAPADSEIPPNPMNFAAYLYPIVKCHVYLPFSCYPFFHSTHSFCSMAFSPCFGFTRIVFEITAQFPISPLIRCFLNNNGKMKKKTKEFWFEMKNKRQFSTVGSGESERMVKRNTFCFAPIETNALFIDDRKWNVGDQLCEMVWLK